MKNIISVRPLFILFLLIGSIGMSAQDARASHFRGVTITWAPTATPGEVEFRFLYSERQTWVNQTLGSTYSVYMDFGDGTSGYASGPITSINTAEDYMVADLKARHVYGGNGPYSAQWSDCCRIGGLVNGGSTITLQTIVTPRNGNRSPVSSIPTVITVPSTTNVNFSIPASDPDGDRLRFRLATTTENGGMSSPIGLTIDPNTGIVDWSTSSYSASQIAAGRLFATQIMIEDLDSSGNVKSKTPVDFIIKFVGNIGTPPTLTIDPAGPLTVSAGSPVTFDVTGTDADSNARVTLNAAGMPTGATMSPAIGAQLSPPVSSTFSWTPTLAQAGPSGNSYVINFTATDENNNQALKSITINVLPVGAPTAIGQSITVQAGVAQNVVLQATDPNGLNLTFTVTGLPGHGTAVLNGLPSCSISGGVSTCTQNVTYTATAGYSGPDVFTFRANNGVSNSNAANVSITVAANRAPVANDDSFSTGEDTALTNANVLTNDNDDDGDPLTAALISPPANAVNFTLNPDGSFFYMPNPNFHGSDSFTYKANDGNLDSNTATVTITVNPVNDAPSLSGAAVTRQQGTPGSVSAIASVADVDNSPGSLTVSVTSLPTGITVTNITNNNGAITATVTAGCNAAVGANTVGLKVTDGEGAIGTGSLTVNVTKETTPPVIGPIANVTAQLPPNSSATSMAVSFPLPTATDNCGGPVTVTTDPVSGSAFNVGTTTVNVTATDQAGNQSTSSFTVTVQYSFSMFYYSGLLLNQQALNQVTAGSNVPVRFTLSGNKGYPYSSPPTSQQINCSTYAPIGAATVINRFAPDPYYSSLYDFYQTTWQTQTNWKFTCRRLSLHMNDGTTKTLDFYFK